MARGLRKWSKTASSNASSDSGVNWAEGMAPSAVNDSARAEMASMSMWRDDNNGTLAGTLSTATYSVTSNQGFDALAAGDTVAFQLSADMPATALLNVDSLGAKPLRPVPGTDFAGGEYKANQIIRASYATSNSGEWIVNGALSNSNIPIHNQTAESAASTSDELPVYSNADSANRKVTVANLLTNVNNLTEDTSPDSSADYTLTYDASATAAKKVKLSNVPSNLPRGYIDGCILSNGTDPINDINITAGKCRDSTDTVDIVVSANTAGKQLDANWAASGTTNSGMRNSAAGITNGTYHIYAARTAASSAATIYAYAGVDGTDPDSAAAISTMLTALQAETGGSSYVYARRIGSILRESASIIAFSQDGDLFLRKATVADADTSNTTSAVLHTISIPSGLKVRVSGDFSFTAGANVTTYFSSPDQNDEAPVAGSKGQFINTGTASWWGPILSSRSRQIRHRDSQASITTTIHVYNWLDSRGKNA